MVDRVASFLADNALTRSWHGSVTAGINAVELPFLKTEQLRESIPDAVARRITSEIKDNEGVYLGSPFAKEVNSFTGIPEDFDFAGMNRAAIGGEIAGAFENMERERIIEYLNWAKKHPSAQRGITSAGDAARMFAANPVAAYSGVIAGGALGTQAGIDAYDYFVAQQQQGMKDAQVPLDSSAEVM